MINEIENIDLTSTDVEKQIEDYDLKFLGVRRNDIEWKFKFPIFVYVFYEIIKEEGNIPTQSYFFDFYLDKFSENSVISKLNKDQLEGLKARIYRTYPSYIRDIHFSNLVSEQTNFDKVIYDLELDVKEGIDILIENNNKEYGVNLYIDTNRSKKARDKKEDRHDDNEYYEIELPLSFWDADEIGDFYLYPKSYLEELYEIIGR